MTHPHWLFLSPIHILKPSQGQYCCQLGSLWITTPWTWRLETNISSNLPGAWSHVKKQQWTEKTWELKWTHNMHNSAYPGCPVSFLCYLAGPRWSQAVPTPHCHVLIHVLRTDVGLQIHTDNVTSSHCSTQSFGCRQTPVFTSCLKIGSNPQWWGHLLPKGMRGGERERPLKKKENSVMFI